jgi:hypothetical protein
MTFTNFGKRVGPLVNFREVNPFLFSRKGVKTSSFSKSNT